MNLLHLLSQVGQLSRKISEDLDLEKRNPGDEPDADLLSV